MSIEVKVPVLPESVSDATIATWHKKAGDSVRRDENLLDLETGDTERISPGQGKTTCAWIHPDGERVMYALTQDDAESVKKQEAELAERKAGTVNEGVSNGRLASGMFVTLLAAYFLFGALGNRLDKVMTSFIPN